jgi:serine/threonine protein kinase
MGQATNEGQRFGPFIIGEKLGNGGMAVVYKAFNSETQQTVALKVLRNSVAENSSALERFELEASIAERLKHPHIVRIYSHGNTRGRHYLEMQFMSGGTLQNRLSQPLVMTVQESIRLLRNVASALDYAHANGVIHRDLKLENILMDDQGKAYLSDFGIARVANMARLTATGTMVGTPLYLSPEQILGQPHDHRADLYALGIVAYVLIVGQFPFDSDNVATILNAHIALPVPVPSTFNRLIPPGLDSVLLRALSKHPDERHASADAFVEALARSLEGGEMKSSRIDLTRHTGMRKLAEAPAIAGPRTADDWVREAESETDSFRAIQHLRQALQLEPMNSKANRLLFQLEGGQPGAEPRALAVTPPREVRVQSASAPAASGASYLAARVKTPNLVDEPLRKVTSRKKGNGGWGLIGGLAAVAVIGLLVFGFLAATGSPLISRVNNALQGVSPVYEVDGVPIAQASNAVMKVQPVQAGGIFLNDAAQGVLEHGIANEYRFRTERGMNIAVLVQFFMPEAQRVSRNVAIIDPAGNPANCERQQLADGGPGIVAFCNNTVQGEWRVRVLGIEGQSIGPYVVSYQQAGA